MSFAVVLGGGGMIGVAWEVGVLRGLAAGDAPGLRDAAAVVGTSAGSIVSAQVLTGASLDQLAAEQLDTDQLATPAMAEATRDPSKMLEIFRLWGAPGPMTQGRAAEIGRAALEAPTVAEEQWLAGFADRFTAPWPDHDLRVVAVRCDTGERTVWTRDSGVDLGRALASSCAVPGLFPAVTIGDARYTDGGVWSCTSADVVADVAGGDITDVVAVAPMVGASGVGQVCALALEHETKVLADHGVTLHAIVPGERFQAAQFNLMDATRRAEALEIGEEQGRDAAGELARALRA